MNKEELAAIVPKVAIAIAAGRVAADACPDDKGSANCDRVVIPVAGLRLSTIKASGIRGYVQEASQFHQRGIHLEAPFPGIGNKRYAGVQAMQKSLKKQGVDCYVWYQMD